MSRIYTKTGDKGESGIVGGKRMMKDERIFWVMGTLDELSAFLSSSQLEINQAKDNSYREISRQVERVQRDLLLIGSEIAQIYIKPDNPSFVGMERITEFEKQIDEWTADLPELNDFVIPGGNRASVILHQARTICRRAERELVSLSREAELRMELVTYLNRLGDWLFIAACFANQRAD